MTTGTATLEIAPVRGWPYQSPWVVRARHGGDEELFVSGEFNHWQLPGVPMDRIAASTWEARVPLTTNDLRRFACFVYLDHGFRALPSEDIECSREPFTQHEEN